MIFFLFKFFLFFCILTFFFIFFLFYIIGNTSNSGHYYAYVRGTEHVDELDLKDASLSPWMKMNDSKINIVGFNKMRENIRESVSATGTVQN